MRRHVPCIEDGDPCYTPEPCLGVHADARDAANTHPFARSLRNGVNIQMASVTYPGLYLGRLAEMDTNEQVAGAETYAPLVGRTFGTSSVPLYTTSTRITLNDDNNDGSVGFDHNGSMETIRYTLGDTTQAHRLDNGVLVQNVTVWIPPHFTGQSGWG